MSVLCARYALPCGLRKENEWQNLEMKKHPVRMFYLPHPLRKSMPLETRKLTNEYKRLRTCKTTWFALQTEWFLYMDVFARNSCDETIQYMSRCEKHCRRSDLDDHFGWSTTAHALRHTYKHLSLKCCKEIFTWRHCFDEEPP